MPAASAVDHEVVGEEQLPDVGDVHHAVREDGVVEDALHGGADGQEPGGVCIAHGLAKVVAKARAEHGQGQAGDVLVGPQGDGQHGEDQGADTGADQRTDHGDDQGNVGVGPPGFFIVVGAEDAGDAAHEHHALDAQVHVAGFLRQRLAQHAEEQRGRRQDAGGEEIDEVIHARRPPFLRCPVMPPGLLGPVLPGPWPCCPGRSCGS